MNVGEKSKKELIATSKIVLPDDCEERGSLRKQYQGKCVKWRGVVNMLEVGNDTQVYTHAKCWKKIRNLKAIKLEKGKRLDRI